MVSVKLILIRTYGWLLRGGMRRYLAQSENTAELDARKVYKAARDAMQVLCQARYELFGAAGHASKIKAIPLSEMAKRY